MHHNDQIIITIAIVAGLIILIPFIFYLLSLQKTLKLVGPQHQSMSPGLVWLNLIPIFSLGWHFYTVSKITQSLNSWHHSRDQQDPDNGANTLGITMCALMVATIIPLIGGLISIAALVIWIIYWVKIAGYNKQLTLAN